MGNKLPTEEQQSHHHLLLQADYTWTPHYLHLNWSSQNTLIIVYLAELPSSF